MADNSIESNMGTGKGFEWDIDELRKLKAIDKSKKVTMNTHRNVLYNIALYSILYYIIVLYSIVLYRIMSYLYLLFVPYTAKK